MQFRKPLGYFLLGISCIAWAVLPVIPFLPISVSEKAAWGGGIFIFAEITWWLAVPLLGKEMLQWTQYAWRWVKAQLGSSDVSSEGQTSKTSSDTES